MLRCENLVVESQSPLLHCMRAARIGMKSGILDIGLKQRRLMAQDPSWCVKKAIREEVQREDTMRWALEEKPAALFLDPVVVKKPIRIDHLLLSLLP